MQFQVVHENLLWLGATSQMFEEAASAVNKEFTVEAVRFSAETDPKGLKVASLEARNSVVMGRFLDEIEALRLRE